MDFIENPRRFLQKFKNRETPIQTEEATKNAFILPFINALGMIFLIRLKSFLNILLMWE